MNRRKFMKLLGASAGSLILAGLPGPNPNYKLSEGYPRLVALNGNQGELADVLNEMVMHVIDNMSERELIAYENFINQDGGKDERKE